MIAAGWVGTDATDDIRAGGDRIRRERASADFAPRLFRLIIGKIQHRPAHWRYARERVHHHVRIANVGVHAGPIPIAQIETARIREGFFFSVGFAHLAGSRVRRNPWPSARIRGRAAEHWRTLEQRDVCPGAGG